MPPPSLLQISEISNNYEVLIKEISNIWEVLMREISNNWEVLMRDISNNWEFLTWCDQILLLSADLPAPEQMRLDKHPEKKTLFSELSFPASSSIPSAWNLAHHLETPTVHHQGYSTKHKLVNVAFVININRNTKTKIHTHVN